MQVELAPALGDNRFAGQDSASELLQFFNLYHHLMGEMSQARDQNALGNGAGCAPGLLADVALREAALASLRLLAGEGTSSMPPRRAVLEAEVADRQARENSASWC